MSIQKNDSVLSSFDDLVRDVMKNQDARVAAIENGIRRKLAETIISKIKNDKITEKEFAKASGIRPAELRRLLNKELGGNLSLRTLVRAADAVGLALVVKLD